MICFSRILTMLPALLCLLLLQQTTTVYGQQDAIAQPIYEAIQSGQNKIVLPEGTFKLSKSIYLKQSAKNLTITGQGKTHLIMTNLVPLFMVLGAQNVTIDGITLDYDPLPFTQATITEIQGKQVTFELHGGYPRLTPTYLTSRQLMIFDGKTRNWKWEQEDNYRTELNATSENSGVMTLKNLPDQIQVGDYICLESRVGRAFFLREQAKDITFSNITILSSPGICFDARRVEGTHHFDHVVVKRGPTPEAADQPRLISASADGINYADTRQGPVIENCDIAWQGDDGVNLHGTTFPVVRCNDDGSFLTVMIWRPTDLNKIIHPGDQARILAENTYAIVKQCTIEFFQPLEDVQGITDQQVRQLYPGYANSEMGFPNFIVYQVKFSGDVPQVGQFIDIPAASCPKFRIANTRFAHHKARGVRIMANHGVIENCNFLDIPQSAIYIGSEYNNWMEAGWASDIIIRNNQIRNVCRGGQAWSRYYYAPGAIALSGRCAYGNTLVYPGNQNIQILNNTIEGSGVSAIAILAGQQIDIQANTYHDVNRKGPVQAAAKYGVQYEPKPIFIWDQATQGIRINTASQTTTN